MSVFKLLKLLINYYPIQIVLLLCLLLSSTLLRYSKPYYLLVIRNSPFSSLLVTYKTQRSQPSCSNSIKSCEIMPYSVLLLMLLHPLMMQGRNELQQGDSVLEKLFVDIAAITKHVFVNKKVKNLFTYRDIMSSNISTKV